MASVRAALLVGVDGALTLALPVRGRIIGSRLESRAIRNLALANLFGLVHTWHFLRAKMIHSISEENTTFAWQ